MPKYDCLLTFYISVYQLATRFQTLGMTFEGLGGFPDKCTPFFLSHSCWWRDDRHCPYAQTGREDPHRHEWNLISRIFKWNWLFSNIVCSFCKQFMFSDRKMETIPIWILNGEKQELCGETLFLFIIICLLALPQDEDIFGWLFSA